MNLPVTSIRLFRISLMVWVAVFSLFGWMGFDAANVLMRSPLWAPSGTLRVVTHALPLLEQWASWGALVPLTAPVILFLLALHQLFRAPRWWIALLIWWLYLNIMNTGWLSGSGGQQLIANLLFWNILLSIGQAVEAPAASHARATAFWIVRLQVLLAYLATGLHKLTGTHWLDGTAMGIVATDPAFGPAWIAGFPLLAMLLTWAVLFFQLTFPLAVWHRATRVPWMLFGVAFHLGTAWWMGIPEMAFAFLVGYTIWLSPAETTVIMHAFRQGRTTSLPAT